MLVKFLAKVQLSFEIVSTKFETFKKNELDLTENVNFLMGEKRSSQNHENFYIRV